jgi:membrane fusion protein, multidrug efflux system
MSEILTDPKNDTQQGTRGAVTTRSRGTMLRWFIVLFLVFAVLGVYALVQRRTEHQVLAEQTERMAVPFVSVIHATAIGGESTMVLPGTLKAYVESPIYARTNGYLKKWYKDIGSHVNKGDLLAEIDTPEIDQQLAQMRADLTTAQANLGLAGTTTTRYQELLKSDSVSKQDADNASGNYAARQAMVQSAEANVKRLEELESFKRVYAPFSGVITQRNVDSGNLINAGNGGNANKEMFDLAQIDPLRVFVSVPQSFGPSIHVGMKACLELSEFNGRSFCGKVTRTANSIDPGTRTLLTEVDVPNPSGTLLPGSYAQVNFNVKMSGQRFTLPINALLFRPEGTVAAVVGPDDHLSLKKITIGRDFGANVEVLEGISPEDNIVINPPDALEQGELVKVATQSSAGSSNAQQSQNPK